MCSVGNQETCELNKYLGKHVITDSCEKQKENTKPIADSPILKWLQKKMFIEDFFVTSKK